MTVLASDDDGEAFDRRLLIREGRSYYSAMQLIGCSGGSPGFGGEVALLFERDGGNLSVARFDRCAGCKAHGVGAASTPRGRIKHHGHGGGAPMQIATRYQQPGYS